MANIAEPHQALQCCVSKSERLSVTYLVWLEKGDVHSKGS